MTPQTRALLDLSASDLAAARRDLAASDPRVAVSRAYYAAFHAACAALNSRGLEAKTHAGTHALFGEHFVRTGLLDRVHGRSLNQLLQLREGADYEVGRTITMEDGLDSVDRAVAFVEAVEALLAERPA